MSQRIQQGPFTTSYPSSGFIDPADLGGIRWVMSQTIAVCDMVNQHGLAKRVSVMAPTSAYHSTYHNRVSCARLR